MSEPLTQAAIALRIQYDHIARLREELQIERDKATKLRALVIQEIKDSKT